MVDGMFDTCWLNVKKMHFQIVEVVNQFFRIRMSLSRKQRNLFKKEQQ